MTTVRGILADITLFSGFSDDQLDEVQRISTERRFHSGDMIFFEGDDGDGFYVIVKGKVKIFKLSPEGKEKILHIFGPGEPFGEVAVFSGEKFPANAQALISSDLLFFPRSSFLNLIATHPTLSMKMLAVLSLRLRQFAVQIESLSLKEVPARLASYLIYLDTEQGGHDSVTLEISKGQLASLLGTIPETLSRMLAKMSEQSLIDVNGQTIRLLDPEGLRILAESGKLSA